MIIYFNLLRKEYALALAKAILKCVKTGNTNKVDKVLPVIKKEVFNTYNPENAFRKGQEFFANVEKNINLISKKQNTFEFISTRHQKYSGMENEKVLWKYLEDHWDLKIGGKEFSDINIVSHFDENKKEEFFNNLFAKRDAKRNKYKLQKEAAELKFIGADLKEKRYLIDKQISNFISNINMHCEGHGKFHGEYYTSKDRELYNETCKREVNINNLCDQFLTDLDFDSYWFLIGFNNSCRFTKNGRLITNNMIEDTIVDNMVSAAFKNNLTTNFGDALKDSKCNK